MAVKPKSKAKTIFMEGYLKWPKFLKSNMDTKFNEDGVYQTEFYPSSKDELSKLLDEAKSRNKEIRVGDPSDGEGYGLGKFVRLKRNNVNRIEEFSGPPTVVHLDEGSSHGEPWDYNTDGLLGNGTKVKVKVVMYGEGHMAGVRLEKVGVLDHVAYGDPAEFADAF